MALLDAAIVLVIFLGCSTVGLLVRPLLSERHRSREVTEVVRLVVAMLVTFAALVLGLLTSSVKTSFDKVADDLRGLAIQLIQLDRSLRQWGTEAQPTRELLQVYTAAVIATTWTKSGTDHNQETADHQKTFEIMEERLPQDEREMDCCQRRGR